VNKRFYVVLIALLVAFSSINIVTAQGRDNLNPISSTQEQVIFSDTITVSAQGGDYQIGFVTIDFPKNFLDKDQLPATFYVKIFAINGIAGIEITPDTPHFKKNVRIIVDKYNGYLYDISKDENIIVKVKKQVIIAKHFSWYRFR